MPAPLTVTIRMTEAHIAAGRRGHPRRCPFKLAADDALPGYSCSVDYGNDSQSDYGHLMLNAHPDKPGFPPGLYCAVPRELAEAIRRYDKGGDLAPSEVTVTLR